MIVDIIYTNCVPFQNAPQTCCLWGLLITCNNWCVSLHSDPIKVNNTYCVTRLFPAVARYCKRDYWAALSLSFRQISIRRNRVELTWGPQAIIFNFTGPRSACHSA